MVPVRPLPRRTLRSPPSQGRFAHACMRRELGRDRSRRALGHTARSHRPQEVMSAPTTYRGAIGDAGEELTARPIDLNAAASSVRRGGDPIHDENRPDAPPLPGRAAPRIMLATLILVIAASLASRAHRRSRGRRARARLPDRLAEGRRGTSSSSSAAPRTAGAFPEVPRRPCTWPTGSPTSSPTPTTATAARAASSSTCVDTGPAVPTSSASTAGRRSTPGPTSW